MGLLISAYDKLMCWTNGVATLLLFLIRIIWGWQFTWIGWGKLADVSRTTELFSNLGFADPEMMVYLVGGIEMICGALVLVGLLTRLAALPLVIVMIGAYSTAHVEAAMAVFTDFQGFTNEAPFLFLYASLVLLCFGPGKLSVDYLIRGRSDAKG